MEAQELQVPQAQPVPQEQTEQLAQQDLQEQTLQYQALQDLQGRME